MNNVTLMGRLTKDVELRNFTKNGKQSTVARYSVAVPRLGTKETDFFNVVAFNKGADFVSKYFKKGSLIAITGHLQMNTWVDNNKVKHTSVDIVADNQYFTGEQNKKDINADADESKLPF